ncbi:hypothetical protein [Chromobacterium violaceum]|uniref:hypothetical protein n=1 Tax=Chromobacterium violaceum TaxID=536 RepID=UPI0009D9366C|nr:hypothetical protein [Chromobacterium violaceum]OQS30419.1 hypothetical protein B0T41_00225 [Chromobacterium violaceum]
MSGLDKSEFFEALHSEFEEAKSKRTSSAVVVCRFLRDGDVERARLALSRCFEPADQKFHELLTRMGELLAREQTTNEQEQAQ